MKFIVMSPSLLVIVGLFSAAALSEPVVKRQTKQQCDAITLNIEPLKGPCGESSRACITETNAGTFGSIPSIQGFICPPTKTVRENIYDVLVGCVSQEYADQVYGGLCGNTTTAEGRSIACTEAILSISDGSEAKEACCGDGVGPVGSGSPCAAELRTLATDLGCCTATVVMQFFFAECQVGEESGLAALLTETGVEPPPLCNFPLYTAGNKTTTGGGETAGASATAFLLSALLSSVLALEISV